jgi:hypothetical protein
MVAAGVRVRLEGPAEVGHGECGDFTLNAEFHGRLVEGSKRRTYGRKQAALQRQLSGVRVEVADSSEEDLALDTERGADLDQLSNLF